MLQLKDTVDPESPGAAVLHPAEAEEGVEVAFTPPEAGGSFGSSVACCSPLQTLTPFHVHNPTMQAKVKDYFVFRVSPRVKTSQVITVIVLSRQPRLWCLIDRSITHFTSLWSCTNLCWSAAVIRHELLFITTDPVQFCAPMKLSILVNEWWVFALLLRIVKRPNVITNNNTSIHVKWTSTSEWRIKQADEMG